MVSKLCLAKTVQMRNQLLGKTDFLYFLSLPLSSLSTPFPSPPPPLLYFLVLGIDSTAFYMLGKCTSLSYILRPLFVIFLSELLLNCSRWPWTYYLLSLASWDSKPVPPGPAWMVCPWLFTGTTRVRSGGGHLNLSGWPVDWGPCQQIAYTGWA